jgi:hypothetical protein
MHPNCYLFLSFLYLALRHFTTTCYTSIIKREFIEIVFCLGNSTKKLTVIENLYRSQHLLEEKKRRRTKHTFRQNILTDPRGVY